MKKKLLFSLLLTLSFLGFSQTLDSENFNTLTIGNIGTDISGTTAGQGGFGTFADNGEAPTTTTNAAASNFQVVASGKDASQGVQLTSPDGDKGIRFLFKPFTSAWNGRTPGNDIIEIEFSLFAGSTTAGRAPLRAIIFGTDGLDGALIAGFEYDPQTRALSGLARLDNGGTKGTFLFDLGPGNVPLILAENSWNNMGFSYNTVTGQIIWKTDSVSASFSNATFVITGMVPSEVDFLSFGTPAELGPPAVPANAAAVDFIFDNYTSRASATDMLLGIDDPVTEASLISLYPNPADEMITLKTNVSIEKVTIINSLGQVVLEKKADFIGKNQFDISNYKAGIYMMTIKSADGRLDTKRFVKK